MVAMEVLTGSTSLLELGTGLCCRQDSKRDYGETQVQVVVAYYEIYSGELCPR